MNEQEIDSPGKPVRVRVAGMPAPCTLADMESHDGRNWGGLRWLEGMFVD